MKVRRRKEKENKRRWIVGRGQSKQVLGLISVSKSPNSSELFSTLCIYLFLYQQLDISVFNVNTNSTVVISVGLHPHSTNGMCLQRCHFQIYISRISANLLMATSINMSSGSQLLVHYNPDLRVWWSFSGILMHWW